MDLQMRDSKMASKHFIVAKNKTVLYFYPHLLEAETKAKTLII